MTKIPSTRFVKLACSESKYLVRCQCQTFRGYTIRDACRVHGPAALVPKDLAQERQIDFARLSSAV